MKKSELVKKLKTKDLDYEELKKEFNLHFKKGEISINQIVNQMIKKLNSYKIELMQVISPKNIIENHESKMINSSFKEDIYDNIKELSLITWQIKKAILIDEEKMIKSIKTSMNYYLKVYKPMKKKLCEEMIKNWNKEEIKNNYYIS
jgi:Fe-S cluster biosynthesis and repair protein YggX